MIQDSSLVERLNFLKMFKKRVLKELDQMGRAEVLTLEIVPESDGIYWIGGTSKLKDGLPVESVFRVNTDSGGTILAAYWSIAGSWFLTDESDALKELGKSSDEVFPFDWEYNTPLSNDIYHD